MRASGPFSPQALGLMAQQLPEHFTHTGLETLFLTHSVEDTSEGGVSKPRRVLNVLREIREIPGPEQQTVLLGLMAELLGRITNYGELPFEGLSPEQQKLVNAVEADGWTFSGRELVAADREGSASPMETPTAPESAPTPVTTGSSEMSARSATATSKRSFIVHGRDEATKAVVARFVERQGFEAVILHEQANRGRTVFEKFLDEAADAAFALVLLTPDDVGRLASESSASLENRARQNVVLEFGYFVCAPGSSEGRCAGRSWRRNAVRPRRLGVRADVGRRRRLEDGGCQGNEGGRSRRRSEQCLVCSVVSGPRLTCNSRRVEAGIDAHVVPGSATTAARRNGLERSRG